MRAISSPLPFPAPHLRPTMERPIVACIQHRLIVPQSADEYDAHLSRFLRTAKAKGAELALFPELSGLATAIPIFSGWRNDLLRRAGQGQRPRAGVWQRAKARLAGGAASIVRADLHKSLLQALAEMPESLHDAYAAAFSALAQRYEITIVAGSLYDYNPASGDIENVSLVFGPDGALLGRQAKVMLSSQDRAVSGAAEGWTIIPTPAGRVGILLGNDVLYPEPARVLAYQGADMLLTMAAVVNPASYHKIRQAATARCQENQLYGMASFLVGPDPFAAADAAPFVGKSAIFAPLEFTPRFSGVMIEVGSPLAEGVITAELDYPALEALWQESETPLRREMPLLQAGPALAALYGRALPLAEADPLLLESTAPAASETEPDAGVESIPAGPEVSRQREALPAGLGPVETEPGVDSESYAQIPPIWPDASFGHTPGDLITLPAITPAERQAAQAALLGRMEAHAQNVDTAAAEVRSTILQASEQVRAAASETPEEVEAEIVQVVASARLELDDTPPAAALEPAAEPALEPALEPAAEPAPTPRKFRWPWQRR